MGNFNYSVVSIDSLKNGQSLVENGVSMFTETSWLHFLMLDQKKMTPVMVKISKGEHFIGYFYSFLINKYGFKIIGSPFRGWSTCYMGFNLLEGNDPLRILPSLKKFLFLKYHCHLIEIVDNSITLDRAILNNFYALPVGTLLLQIDKSDVDLFKVFKVDCRNFIRQFEKRGAILKIVPPSDTFARCYYLQLIDVFAKQKMIPTYDVEKVKLLLRTVNPENLLCLQVFLPESEECIASSIFLGYHDICYFWGCASLREYQRYRPNEYMIWSAIKYWRDKGFKKLDMIGIRDYKKKFGPYETSYTRIIIPKYKYLIYIRNFAEKLYFLLCSFKFKLRSLVFKNRK